MLLVGGGFGPPLLGLILPATATRIHAPLRWGRTRLWVSLRNVLSKVWLWSFVAAVIAWLLLVPSSSLLVYYFGVNSPNLVMTFILCAFGSLTLTLIIGFAHDAQSKTGATRGSHILLYGQTRLNAMASLSEHYFNNIEAPYKELVWFEHSGHSPLSTQADLLTQTVVEKVLPLANQGYWSIRQKDVTSVPKLYPSCT